MRKDRQGAGMDWVVAGFAGWVDAGEGFAGDAEGDVSDWWEKRGKDGR